MPLTNPPPLRSIAREPMDGKRTAAQRRCEVRGTESFIWSTGHIFVVSAQPRWLRQGSRALQLPPKRQLLSIGHVRFLQNVAFVAHKFGKVLRNQPMSLKIVSVASSLPVTNEQIKTCIRLHNLLNKFALDTILGWKLLFSNWKWH